jgi:hypothetical protein
MEVQLLEKEKYRMETTPDKWCIWEVSRDYLETALKVLHERRIDPSTIKIVSAMACYLIAYYNPPTILPPTKLDSSEGVTIQ